MVGDLSSGLSHPHQSWECLRTSVLVSAALEDGDRELPDIIGKLAEFLHSTLTEKSYLRNKVERIEHPELRSLSTHSHGNMHGHMPQNTCIPINTHKEIVNYAI